MDDLLKYIYLSTNVEYKDLGLDIKSPIFVGNYDGHKIKFIVNIKTTSFENIIQKIDESTNIIKTYENDKFYKFNVDEIEICITYPASLEDIGREHPNKDKKNKLLETYDDYKNNIYPVITHKNINWIKNILDGKVENEHLIYNDNKFVLLPDLKWIMDSDKKRNINNMYCLAIVRDYNLKSIRELNNSHLDLLKHIYKESCTVIQKIYGIENKYLRAYVHYHPSFWHLHIHFNLLKNKLGGAIIDYAIPLHDIITNISIKNDYYQTVSLEIIEKYYKKNEI